MSDRVPEGPQAPPPGSLRWYAWLYTPPERRGATAALFAIEREIAASVRPGLDHGVAHARLEWWQGECERIAAGRPVHPLGQALLAGGAEPVAAPGAPECPALGGLVENARWDLAGAAFENRPELDAYCHRWAGSVASSLVPAAETAAVRYALAIGAVLCELELLEQLTSDARRGKLRLPLDELERNGLEPGALSGLPRSAALAALLRERHDELRDTLERGAQSLPAERRPALRALEVWRSLADRRAARALRALPGPAPERARDRLAEALIAWRAARRALTGRP